MHIKCMTSSVFSFINLIHNIIFNSNSIPDLYLSWLRTSLRISKTIKIEFSWQLFRSLYENNILSYSQYFRTIKVQTAKQSSSKSWNFFSLKIHSNYLKYDFKKDNNFKTYVQTAHCSIIKSYLYDICLLNM